MRVLIVDDDEMSLDMLEAVLNEMGHQTVRAANGVAALAALRQGDIHLVITDWEMPEMNGLELCRAIRQEDFDGYVYVIMLTSRDGAQQRLEGLWGGADAFLQKPLNPDELLVCFKTADRILCLETRDLAMFALAKLSESRDPETGAHIERVQSYARVLAQYLLTTERYCDKIDPEFVRLIFQTSPLHDIGKVGIPDNVLLKPGKLTEPEIAIMRTHTTLGAQTLDASLQRFPNARFLQMARDIAIAHHERFDGKGYPRGLAGEQIPLAARIVALADVYDALTSKRVYRDAMSHAQARRYIVAERGAHFDPEVTDAFVALEKQFVAIRQRFADDASVAPVVSPAEALASATSMASVATATPPGPSVDTVMVVDDDAGTRDLLTHFLLGQGLECIACPDARDALDKLNAGAQPRLIFSDWDMPGIDGLEFCRRVRARSAAATAVRAHVHFIMLTVHAAPADLERAFDAGVDDFLAKPFDQLALTARLRSSLRAVSLCDELAREHRESRQLNDMLTSLNHRLERLAVTDDLTGLYNRRQATLRLEEHWAMCERYGRPLAVVTLDIDHFKQINDRHGHPCGDDVLRGVAETLRQCVRGTDTVCRVGGEEFLIMLPNQTIVEAEQCAHRCRKAIAARPFHNAGGEAISVTVSLGVAARRPETASCTDMVREADEALYAAKRGGRNAVRCARAEGITVPEAEQSPATAA